MKYLQIHIKGESADDIGKFLTDIVNKFEKHGLEFEIAYKDSDVEEQVKQFMAESMGHEKYFKVKDDNKL